MIYKRFLIYYKPYIGRLISSIICMICGSGLLALSRLLIKPLIDSVFVDKDVNMLHVIVTAVILIYFLLGILNYARNYLTAYIAQRIIMNIRNEMYTHLQCLSLDYYAKGSTGKTMSRLTNDVSLLQNTFTRVPAIIVYDGFSAIFLLSVLFYLHWKLAFICIAILLIAAVPIVVFGRKMRYLSMCAQKQIASVYSHIQESMVGVIITKAFNREKTEIERFSTTNKGFYEFMMRFVRVEAKNSPIIEFIGALAISVVLYIAAKDVIAGRWSTGAFFAFVGTAFSIGAPVRNIVQINPYLQQALSAIERIFSLLDEKSNIVEMPDAYPLPPFKKEIKYDNVSFEYEPGRKVLKDINLAIKSNEIIGIVGPSGSGKTTLVHLLLRFYDPSKGKIFVDNHDIRNVKLKSLREQIGIVTQETILFNESIKYNIAYGKDNTTEDDITNASIAANAHEFIKKLPEGYDTVVGEKGTLLSGGEKQRIAIARAIIRNPRILVLDEATSALDAESEKLVQDALEKLMTGKTVLLIAHRLATVKKCDRIIVLDNGYIVETGTHDELFHKEGVYKRLHQLQLI